MIKDEIIDENEELELSKAERLQRQAEYNLALIAPKYERAVARVAWCKEQVLMAQTGRYYVYVVFVDGIAVYVGKGKGDRYKHPVSGASSCVELNRDFFQGKYIEVRFLEKYKTEQEALELEKYWIGIVKGMTFGDWSIYNRCSTPPDYNHDISYGCLHSISKFATQNDAPPINPRHLRKEDKE